MKNKFNAGDKVIFIFRNDKYKSWEFSNEEIESVSLYVDKVKYFLKDGCDEIEEAQLFTKQEAIKFLEENLNDR
jgi:hypothetical protein